MKTSIQTILILFFCVSLTISFEAQGQDYSSIDLQNINVDDLTDDQIRTFINRAQSTGMTQTQLEELARQRGMSELEISKLRTRIFQLEPDLALVEDGSSTSDLSMGRLRTDPVTEDPLGTSVSISESPLQMGLPIFGSELFNSTEEEEGFASNLNVATPKDYLLGAGDELFIDVYGASEITYQTIISPDGQIAIAGIGPIVVGGITVEQARVRILNKLSTIYAGLKGRNPNTYAQVTVGNIRSIKVHVIGHVKQPGSYVLNSFSNILNALYLAGGPNAKGSMREIRLIRDGESIGIFDVYDYLFFPGDAENPILQDGDQIIVNPYLNRVALSGRVKNPARYELSTGETLEQLMDFSGGFDGKAYSEKVVIHRNTSKERALVTVQREAFSTTNLYDGDSIHIEPIVNRYQNRVTISGAVMRPGAYELKEGMMLSDLIESVDGLREDAFLGRGNIFRKKEDLSPINISFDVQGILSGAQNILLQRDDQIIIQSIFDLRQIQNVQVKGEVRSPGVYQYMEGMTVEDVITQAGGFRTAANKSVVEVARQLSFDNGDIEQTAELFTFPIDEQLNISDEASSFELEPFDVILIKRSSFFQTQKIVKIEGEVLYPGFYALETREDKISDLILRAGGLTEFAYSKGATILRRNEFFEDSTTNSADELEAEFYRSKRLIELQKRDAKNQVSGIGKKESIGISLEQSLANPGSKFDLILKDGDIISVPREIQTVRVRGNVLYPNTVRYELGMSAKRAISSSGGFTDDARPSKTYVIYANGSASRTKRFLFFKKYPKLAPGAEVIVPQRVRERQPLNAQQLIGITSSLATLVLVITQLNK